MALRRPHPSSPPAALLPWTALILGIVGGCDPSHPLPHSPGRYELAEGIVVELLQPPADGRVEERPLVTLVHFDPARYPLRLLTAERYGSARTALEWLRDFDLLGVVNASMYLPNRRSTGFMVDGDRLNNGAVNPRFGGFLAFDPVVDGIPPVVFEGSECDGFDLQRLREHYRVIVQNYRLLDCDGQPIAWQDPKSYSSAAIGLDHNGWVVFVHTGDPCRVSDLGRWLASDEWGLVSAHFVEGGAEASLVVEAGERSIREVGSFESGFGNRNGLRPIPNVIGFAPLATE